MAYSQLQKMETNVHIRASAEQFQDVICSRSRTHHIAKVCPDVIKATEIHEGEWGTEGSIVSCHHIHDGKASVTKQLVESIDLKNNKMTFKVLEGDLLGYYKSFKFIMQVTPKGEGNEVHWILEYEKQNDNIPDPHPLLQLTVKMSKDIDAYFTQNHK